MKTRTMEHVWVKHTITPVQVLTDGEGQPVVLVDPDQQIIAEDQAVYGCQVCSNPMATHFDTECEGEDE